jgi:hypothetical protein
MLLGNGSGSAQRSPQGKEYSQYSTVDGGTLGRANRGAKAVRVLSLTVISAGFCDIGAGADPGVLHYKGPKPRLSGQIGCSFRERSGAQSDGERLNVPRMR